MGYAAIRTLVAATAERDGAHVSVEFRDEHGQR